MLLRDLFRCHLDDLGRAVCSCEQTVLHRGVSRPASALEAADLETLASHPHFDPSLSFVAFDAGEPVGFLVSRIEGDEAVLTLFGSASGSERSVGTLLDEGMDAWRREGVQRVRTGPTALLVSAPRMTEDADVMALLKERDFEVTSVSSEMGRDLRKLPPSAREEDVRRKGLLVHAASADQVAQVARQFHPRRTGQGSQEHWNVFIRRLVPEALVVAEFRRQLVGFASLLGWTLDDEAPHLGPRFVEPVHAETGLGDVLLVHTLQAARDAGKSAVRTHCPSDDAQACERAGFTPTTRHCLTASAPLD